MWARSFEQQNRSECLEFVKAPAQESCPLPQHPSDLAASIRSLPDLHACASAVAPMAIGGTCEDLTGFRISKLEARARGSLPRSMGEIPGVALSYRVG